MINDMKISMFIINEKVGIAAEKLKEKQPNKNSRKLQYLNIFFKNHRMKMTK